MMSLGPFIKKFILIFFDDILVYSKVEEEHISHLEQTLKVLTKHQLYANLKKCEFGKASIFYLGHMVSSEDVGVDQEKIQTVVE